MHHVLPAKAALVHPVSAASPASPVTAMTAVASAANVVGEASVPAGLPSANSTRREATVLRGPSRTVPRDPFLRIGRTAQPVLFPRTVQIALLVLFPPSVLIALTVLAVLFPPIVATGLAVLPVPKVPAAMPVSHPAALELKSPTENQGVSRLEATLENPEVAASPGKSPMANPPQVSPENLSIPSINSRAIKSPSENGLQRVNSNLRKARLLDDASARQLESRESA